MTTMLEISRLNLCKNIEMWWTSNFNYLCYTAIWWRTTIFLNWIHRLGPVIGRVETSKNTVHPSALPVSCLWNKEPLKVSMIPNDHELCSLKATLINLVPFRIFRFLIPQTRNWSSTGLVGILTGLYLGKYFYVKTGNGMYLNLFCVFPHGL